MNQKDDIQELLDLVSEDLTDDNLLLGQQRVFEEADNYVKGDNVQMKKFALKQFEDIFQRVEFLKQKSWMLTVTSNEGANSLRYR